MIGPAVVTFEGTAWVDMPGVMAAPPALITGVQRDLRVDDILLDELSHVLPPKESALLPNYPNPFNPETWIPYQLAEGADVAIEIYSTSGRLIRVLELGYRNAGVHTTKQKAAYWDGRNDHGEPVSSGIYFYRIKAGSFTRMRKLAIVF